MKHLSLPGPGEEGRDLSDEGEGVVRVADHLCHAPRKQQHHHGILVMNLREIQKSAVFFISEIIIISSVVSLIEISCLLEGRKKGRK